MQNSTDFLRFLIGMLLLLLISCKQEPVHQNENLAKVKSDSLVKRHSFRVSERLNPQARELVQTWDEYTKLDNFITDLQNPDAGKILSYSDELARLAQQLKDSIRIETFTSPDYKIRLNVIDNEAKRLLDMSTIPSITDKAVFDEYQRFVDAFSALNSKLNNEVEKSKIDEELRRFIDQVAQDSGKTPNTGSFKQVKREPKPRHNKPPEHKKKRIKPSKIEIKSGDDLLKNSKKLPVKKKN